METLWVVNKYFGSFDEYCGWHQYTASLLISLFPILSQPMGVRTIAPEESGLLDNDLQRCLPARKTSLWIISPWIVVPGVLLRDNDLKDNCPQTSCPWKLPPRKIAYRMICHLHYYPSDKWPRGKTPLPPPSAIEKNLPKDKLNPRCLFPKN